MTGRKLLTLAPTAAGVAILAVSASAYACTVFLGTFSVTGNALGCGTVTATGNGHSMGQTVSSGVARCGKGAATGFTVSTGANGTQKLPAGTYDVNFWNSDPLNASPGYTNHGNWSTDCMDAAARVPQTGQNVGSMTVGSDGTINGIGSSVTFNNAIAPFATANAESAVCISDSSGLIGNEAPLTIIGGMPLAPACNQAANGGALWQDEYGAWWRCDPSEQDWAPKPGANPPFCFFGNINQVWQDPGTGITYRCGVLDGERAKYGWKPS